MNGKIIKRILTDDSGQEFIAYQATVTDAVVNPETGKNVTEELRNLKLQVNEGVKTSTTNTASAKASAAAAESSAAEAKASAAASEASASAAAASAADAQVSAENAATDAVNAVTPQVELMQFTASQAEQNADKAANYLQALNTTIQNLPDGEAVAAQVAVNSVKIQEMSDEVTRTVLVTEDEWERIIRNKALYETFCSTYPGWYVAVYDGEVSASNTVIEEDGKLTLSGVVYEDGRVVLDAVIDENGKLTL